MAGREPGGDSPRGASDEDSTSATAAEAGERAMTKRSESTTMEHEVTKAVRRVRASDVLGPRGILQIEHEGEIYTLRVTRNNRLILTK